MLKANRDYEGRSILAQSPSKHATAEIYNDRCESWLERNGFMTREVEYEDIFQKHYDSLDQPYMRYYIRIFSRMVVHENGDQFDS